MRVIEVFRFAFVKSPLCPCISGQKRGANGLCSSPKDEEIMRREAAA